VKLLLANLALAGFVLQFPLVAAILTKKLWRAFPLFSLYAVTNFIQTAGMYALPAAGGTPHLTFYFYWIFEGIAVLLGFGVVYEAFRTLFQEYSALRRLAVASFRWALTALVMLGIVVALAQRSGDKSPLVAGVMLVEETARTIELGALMFLFLFSRAFGLHWRQQIFGIAMGLGIFVATELGAVTMSAYFGPVAYRAFALARGFSFNISALVWLGYLLVPERATSRAELPDRAQLEQWNQAIMELIHQ
jgi:hypothetical protein